MLTTAAETWWEFESQRFTLFFVEFLCPGVVGFSVLLCAAVLTF